MVSFTELLAEYMWENAPLSSNEIYVYVIELNSTDTHRPQS